MYNYRWREWFWWEEYLFLTATRITLKKGKATTIFCSGLAHCKETFSLLQISETKSGGKFFFFFFFWKNILVLMVWRTQRERGLKEENCLTFHFGWIGLKYKSRPRGAYGLLETKFGVGDAASISPRTNTHTRGESGVHDKYLSLPRDCQSCWSVLAPLPLHLFLEDQVGRRQSETRSCVSSNFRWKKLGCW